MAVLAEPLDVTESDPSIVPLTRAALHGITRALASVGRAFVCLDPSFHIVHASHLLDELLGAGTASNLRGQPVDELLGVELFGSSGPLRQALLNGQMREGWRATLRFGNSPARLVSITAAPMQREGSEICDPRVMYLVLLRPAEEEEACPDAPAFCSDAVACSPAMQRIFRLVETLQQSEATVLISGESGTGKEVVARAIHQRSVRGGGPFVAVNCGALPGELLEAELFGHVRGAFTGAVRDRVGRFELASRGTWLTPNRPLVQIRIGVMAMGRRALSRIAFQPINTIPSAPKPDFRVFPIPSAAQLLELTAQVATNNRFSSIESTSDAQIMAAVSSGVKHVIYILKENRTYDQVLGDLVDANGMPIGEQDTSLVQWGQAITPNEHSLARTFVTLDHFYATSEVSYDGWLWSTSAQSPDVVEHQFPVVYGFRALSLDSEGLNRSVNTALPTLAGRIAADPLTPNDPDVLPGQTAVSAPDGPNNEINTGYIWNAVLRAGLTVRNYGFFIDTTCYNQPGCFIPEVHYPASSNTVVATSSNAALAPYTDPYFRGFDNNFPIIIAIKSGSANSMLTTPAAEFPRSAWFGSCTITPEDFGTAIDMVNTPELMQADNDYAVGLIVQKIASSIYAQNTLIFVVEDDAQDGADHVDSHRTVAFVAGAYVKQGAVISTHYNTIDFIRTMEEVLGLKQYLNLNDALGHPMTDIFTTTPQPWQFTAAPSAYLYASQLPLPSAPVGMKVPKSTHNSVYWARVTRGLDFSDSDRVDPLVFNRILWKGAMHNKPLPLSLKKAHSDDDDDGRPRKSPLPTS